MNTKYLTAKQAAAYLNVSVRTLLDWKKKKLLIPQTIGGKLYYTIEGIEKALHNKE